MKLEELIEALGGKVAAGDPERTVEGVNSVELARAADLVFAEDAASAAKALASNAGAVVLRAGSAESYPQGKCVVEADQPRLWFVRAAKLLRPAPLATGVHPSAVIGPQVELGENVTIGPCAVVGENARIGAGTRIEAGAVVGQGVRIGDDCRIHPHAVLYPGTTLGNRVIVHAGTVLGADGFGYARDPATGAYTQFPQQGTLVVEDDVEFAANCAIARGALEQTRIGRGTKIDNLVHIAHNCEIGEDVILAGCTAMAGSAWVGSGVATGGQVGIGDHAHVGPGVILGGQAGVFSGKTVTCDGLKPGTVFWGTPARPLKQVLREQVVLARLAKKQGTGNREQ